MSEGHGDVLFASMFLLLLYKSVFAQYARLQYIDFFQYFKQCLFPLLSKTALLEGLEVDQYMWGILNAIQKYAKTGNKCVELIINDSLDHNHLFSPVFKQLRV